MDEFKIVCITPVRNEAWILDKFLACAGLWADHIILADQGSTDGSRDIARRHSKVRVVDNVSPDFNEAERQELLFREAATIKGVGLIVALDADEFLSANFLDDPEWQLVMAQAPGTVIEFDLVNLCPDLKKYWSPLRIQRGYVPGPGAGFRANGPIHVRKVPDADQRFVCRSVKILHYQYTDWERMRSKHHWYQAWERVHYPHQSAIDIYRRYHHMYAVPPGAIKSLDPSWLTGYLERGIEVLSVKKEERYYWDDLVVEFFRQYGSAYFSSLDLWRRYWPGVDDPRNFLERLLHAWLRWSQPHARSLVVRAVDKILRKMV